MVHLAPLFLFLTYGLAMYKTGELIVLCYALAMRSCAPAIARTFWAVLAMAAFSFEGLLLGMLYGVFKFSYLD